MVQQPKHNPSKHRFSKREIANTRAIFHAVYPLCFMGKGADKLPLKVGIKSDIAAAFPDIDRRLLAATLTDYTYGPKYLGQIVAGAARVDLNGAFSGVVTADHADFAAERLAKLQRKWSRRMKK